MAARGRGGGGRAAGRPPGSAVPVVLEKHGRFLAGRPLFPEPGTPRRLELERARDARIGDLVVAVGAGGRRWRVGRRIGRPDVARAVLEAHLVARGARRRFDPAVDRAARHAGQEPPDPDATTRRDLRDLPTFTIDPPTARDFDDAISAQRLENGVTRVWVHIADVAAHVPAGSPVDREAHRRATSVYVPGLVEPMLPEALSNDACSLRPHADRLAVTVELDFVGDTVRRSAFHRSVVRSDARLDYPQVDRILLGAERAQEPWAAPLDAAREVAAALAARRAARGGLEVAGAEPAFAFDAEGHVTGMQREAQTEAHTLIEHLMIAANEAVAALLEDQGVPALFRVHENPDGGSAHLLVERLAVLGVPTPPVSETLSRDQAAEVVAEASRLAAAEGAGEGVRTLILRSLKQAHYAPRNVGHAGLGSSRYCHFTSPIRRYPDLVDHRALLAALGRGETAPARSGMEELGTWCSARERDAVATERRADAIARCFLLERRLFETGPEQEWAGQVTGVIGAGAFVSFGEGFEGLLPVRRLKGDWWSLDPLEVMLVGGSGGARIRIGDPVTVQVTGVDPPRGRADLAPVQLGS